MTKKIILDLCSGSGAWSQPYLAAGYDVRRFDLPEDVRLLHRIKEPIHGILCAPPCTFFAGASAWVKRTDDEYKLGLSIVDACLRFVIVHKPKFWALENPRGTLHRWIGQPRLWFHPCDYGDPYTKKTGIWGDFVIPERTPVAPVEGSVTCRNGCRGSGQRAERAKTPKGFAQAFCKANP